MSREISKDFDLLKEFIKSYNLASLLSEPQFINHLSKQHKKYYAYLLCIAELISLSTDKKLKPELSSNQLSFVKESCSDVGSSLFVMAQGAYKASEIMLRSSIETFLKGFVLDDINDIDKEKSVFAIFDKVKALDFFKENQLNKKIFNSIHLDYKKLCETTHTATPLNMQHITALEYFPKFDIKETTQISETMTRLVSNYMALLTIKYNYHFHKMHHRSKESILENISKPIRRIINGIE